MVQNHRYMLDQITPHVIPRWIVWFVLGALFLIRVFLLQVCGRSIVAVVNWVVAFSSLA